MDELTGFSQSVHAGKVNAFPPVSPPPISSYEGLLKDMYLSTDADIYYVTKKEKTKGITGVSGQKSFNKLTKGLLVDRVRYFHFF